jgi:hypothetical protein
MSNCCFTTRENYFSFTTRENLECHNIADIILLGRKAEIILPSRKAEIILPSRKATITHSRNYYSSLIIECHNKADMNRVNYISFTTRENYISYIMTFYNERRIRVSRVSNCCFTTRENYISFTTRTLETLILHSL